uniref:Uncharacterized protein n=1 Tax=Lactuca sativa TaxID=4236 RepID=A0A9R1URV0_LACSA|nr:hypothetical protein LSAT_V11C800442410 [Lactuca sativa]
MYYCLKNRSLVDGLKELRDEDDYIRFLDVGFDDDDNQISIYIDDYHEPILDWIEEEKAEEGKVILIHMKMMWTWYCRMIYRWTMKLMMRTFSRLNFKNGEGKPSFPIRLWGSPMKKPPFSYRKMEKVCRNAKYFALDEISGSLVSRYEKLWNYGVELLRVNPGSTVLIETNHIADATHYFKRIYVCLKFIKDGWIKGRRRVIGVYSFFLKGILQR